LAVEKGKRMYHTIVMEFFVPLAVVGIVAFLATVALTFPKLTTGKIAIEAVKQRCSVRAGMLLGFAVAVIFTWLMLGA
jgi:hypothetical protein